jgi:acylphosphatase
VIAKRFVVTGRVQGVYFRASTQQQARSLNLCGYAKNRADGSVEVLALGDADAVYALEKWLWHGPPTARVGDVASQMVKLSELRETPTSFHTA